LYWFLRIAQNPESRRLRIMTASDSQPASAPKQRALSLASRGVCLAPVRPEIRSG